MSEAYSKSNDVTVRGLLVDSGIYIYTNAGINIAWNGSVPDKPQRIADSLNGFMNPSWRSEVRLGEGATTYCSGVSFQSSQGWHSFGASDNVMRLDVPAQYASYKSDVSISYSNPLYEANPDPDSSTVARVTNRVIQKFLDNCKSVQSSFEAGQDLGEYRETLESIHHPLGTLHGKLLSYFSSLEKVKKRYKKAASLQKALSDTYLEFRFGWLPLADDVASAVVKCGSYRFPIARVSASAHADFQGSSTQLYLNPPTHSADLKAVIGIKDHSSYYIRYLGGVKTGADQNGRSSTVRELQLLPRDWLPTAWDLLPYSWIADYFTNIGEMIESLCFCFGDLSWAQKTIRNERTYVIHGPIRFDKPLPYWGSDLYWFAPWQRWNSNSYIIPDTTTFMRRQWFREQLTPGDLFARFHFQIPHSKYPYFNLAALLLSRIKPLVPFF